MDPIAEWTASQARVIELVENLSPAQAQLPVPSCPDWTIHDLLAHMVGLGADVVNGDEPDDHNEAWTQAQVDARADHDMAAIVAEWRADRPADRVDERQQHPAAGDVIIHEQDIRGAVGGKRAKDNAGLAALRDRMAAGFAAKVTEQGLGPVALSSPTWTFSTGDGTPALTLHAPQFELTRALMTRRSATQLRGWTTAGDIEPYLPLFAALGSLPDSDLTE